MKNSIANDPVIKLQGDYGWDPVLEYRVWQPEPDLAEPEIGSDFFFAFVTDGNAPEASPLPPTKPEVTRDPSK